MVTEAPQLLYGIGGTLNLNDGDETAIIEQGTFDIPDLIPTPEGEVLQRRGEALGDEHLEKLTIPVPIYIRGATRGRTIELQHLLIQELRRERNELRYNPFPVSRPDDYVIFDTYASFDRTVLDQAYHIHGRAENYLMLKADPFPRGADVTIFDATTVLFEAETAEAAEWTGETVSFSTTNFIYGSQSVRDVATAGLSSTLQRDLATPLNLTPYLTTGWVTMWIYLDSVPPDLSIFVRIGNDFSNHRRWAFTSLLGGWGTATSFVPGWQLIFFDLNNPDAVSGSPNLAAMDYVRVECNVPWGNTGPNFNLDNCTISNGPICSPRARAPFVTTVFGIPGQEDCGFEAKYALSGNVDRITIGRKKDSTNPFPAVVNDPVTATGFTAAASTQNDANCHQGQYKRYSATSSSQKFHPGQFYFHQHEGIFRLMLRFKTADTGTGIKFRWAGYDKNGDWKYGDWIYPNAAGADSSWQVKDLGELYLPLKGFHRDATAANMYTYLGIEVVGTMAANFDVDFTESKPSDGGIIFIQPLTARGYLTLDSRDHTSKGVSMSTDGTPDSSNCVNDRSNGVLKTLSPGDNHIAPLARSTASPNLVPDMALTSLKVTPRYRRVKFS